MQPFSKMHAAINAKHFDDAADHRAAAPWAMRKLARLQVNKGHYYKEPLTRAKATSATSGDTQDMWSTETRDAERIAITIVFVNA